MKITIEYVNNIKSCELEVQKNELNVFYGHNGTGKSSIAMAIKSRMDNGELDRYQSLNYPNSIPNVVLSEEIPCEIFNTDFIDTVVFNRLENSFVKNSYELLIKDDDIVTLEKDISSIKQDIVSLTNEESFLSLKKSVEFISLTLPLKKRGNNAADRISKTKGFKNIEHGNPVLSIRVPLKIRRIAKSQVNSVKWAKWWKSGKDYIFSERCPFCGDTHKDGFSKDIQSILDVLSDANFDTRLNLTNHVDELNKMINKSGNGFSAIINSNKEIYKETNARTILSYVTNIREIATLLNEIYSFDIEKGQSKDLVNHLAQLLKYLSDSLMLAKLSELIQSLKVKEKDLKISKNKINNALRKNISSKEDTINQYLELCNINYKILFREQDLVLIHKSSETLLDGVSHLLSYGEKNSIALLIFTLLNVNKNKLLILDDPISSYDEEKKYAIYSMLFKKSQLKLSKGNYLIYFTHDFENVIEFINNNLYQREIKGYTLTNKCGEIVSQSITKPSLNMIKDYYLAIIDYTKIHFVKLVYIRKMIDLKFITENTLHSYNYISSVLKGNAPSYKTSGNKLTDAEVNNAIKIITRYDSTYEVNLLNDELKLVNLLSFYNKDSVMWFEKTVLFRVIAEKSKNLGLKTVLNDSLDRLSKMSYHIENERVLNLNPISFNIFPSNIEKAMDLFVDGIDAQVNKK